MFIRLMLQIQKGDFCVNEQNIGMTWVLYHESDMQNYVACVGEDEGNTKGKFVAKPGKYYLNVYKFDDKMVNIHY